MAKFSNAAQVRTWAADNGHDVKTGKGVRGRLPKTAIEAFNAAHPRAKYATGKSLPVETVTVKVRPESGKGRSIAKRVVPAQARAWGLAQGLVTGTKGRIPNDVLVAYARTL